MNKALLIIFSVLIISGYCEAQSIKKEFKETFNEVIIGNNGELVSLFYSYNYRNELQVQFVKMNSKGEIHFTKDNPYIIPNNFSGVALPSNEFIYIDPPNTKLVKIDGEGTALFGKFVSIPAGSKISLDKAGNVLVVGSASYDGRFYKFNSNGDELWSKTLVDFTNANVTEFENGYVIAGHKINEAGTNPIQFDKYNDLGEITKSNQFGINDNITGLSANNENLYATTSKGLLIALNKELDTLWTKQIASEIKISKANNHGIFFSEEKRNDDDTRDQTVQQVNFEGNIVWKKVFYNTSVRSFTVTSEDSVILVCSGEYVYPNSQTILLLPESDSETSISTNKNTFFNVYPNPVGENLPLNINIQTEGLLSFYNHKGEKALEVQLKPTDSFVDHHLNKGMYFYQFTNTNSVVYSGKLIIN